MLKLISKQYALLPKCFCLLVLVNLFFVSHAQPVFDAVNLRYQNSPEGANSPDANRFDYLNLSLNIPVVSKKDSSIIVFSPFAEKWKIRADSFPDIPSWTKSVGLPVSLIMPFGKTWSVAFSVIPRWNGYANASYSNFQIGGAMLATYKKRPGLQYKFGLYYNSEFSGPFFMPLLGIDWRIDARNNLYGVLPGNLVYEHKVSKMFYWGASFRSITNTYRQGLYYTSPQPSFLRIQDTQADLYTDFYVLDNVVLSFAAGHSFARKYREGNKNISAGYYHDQTMDAGFYGKISFLYRLRFR